MPTKKYTLAVIGTTFFGAGAAMACGDALLISRDALLGEEFVDSLKEPRVRPASVQTKLGKEYAQALAARGLVGEDAPRSGLAVYSLAEMLKARNVSWMAQTEVTKVEPTKDGFCMTVLHNGGMSTIEATQVLDTTALGTLHDAVGEVAVQKALHVIKRMPTGQLVDDSIPVALGTDWPAARKAVLAAFAKRTEQDARLSLIATTFDYSMPVTHVRIAPGFAWHPSCAHQGLLEALDAGAQWMEGGMLA